MFQLHLLKNKVGQLLMRVGQLLSDNAQESAEASVPDDENLPPAHWLEMVAQKAPGWLDESQHPLIVRYRSSQIKAATAKSSSANYRPVLVRSVSQPVGEHQATEQQKQQKQPELPEPILNNSNTATPQSAEKISFYKSNEETKQKASSAAMQFSTKKDKLHQAQERSQSMKNKNKPQYVGKPPLLDDIKSIKKNNCAIARVKPYKVPSLFSQKEKSQEAPCYLSGEDANANSILEPISDHRKGKMTAPMQNVKERITAPQPLSAKFVKHAKSESSKMSAYPDAIIASTKSVVTKPQKEKKHTVNLKKQGQLAQDNNHYNMAIFTKVAYNKYQNPSHKIQSKVSVVTPKHEPRFEDLKRVQTSTKNEYTAPTTNAGLWPELSQDERNTSQLWPKLASECSNVELCDSAQTKLSEVQTDQAFNGFEQRQSLEQRGQLWNE